METPCDWAKQAITKKGESFTLSKEGKSVTAVLETAEEINIGGGYEGFQFGWTAPHADTNPEGDGMYTVTGGGVGETELFLVSNPTSENDYWAASVTCEAG